MKNLIFLGASVLLVWSARADADRVFDIDTYLAMKSTSGISVSPDGAFLAYTVTKNDLYERYFDWLEMYPGASRT